MTKNDNIPGLLADVGIGEETILAIVGNGFDHVQTIQSLTTGSRNTLHRVRLGNSNGHSQTAVLKWYLPQLDRFFEHRYRREEKLLSLLNMWFAERVPRVYGGIIAPQRFGLLVMEDLGGLLLEEVLSSADQITKRDLLSQAIDLLAQLHHATRTHYTPFYRTCYSVELDRLTFLTYERKLRISVNRLIHLHNYLLHLTDADQISDESQTPKLGTLGLKEDWTQVRNTYSSVVLRPLTSSPKTIIHNSYSPSHLLLHSGKLKLIDFETMTVGVPQVDLAEFLRHPFIGLKDSEVQSGLQQYLHNSSAWNCESDLAVFEQVFWCADISRSMDYAGTLARRCIRYLAGSQLDNAQKARVRCLAYLDEVVSSSNHLPIEWRRMPLHAVIERLKETLVDAWSAVEDSQLADIG